MHLLPTTTYLQVGIFKSGTRHAPITVMGDGVAPQLTQVRADGSNFGIQINPASYVVLKDFDVAAPGPWAGIYVGDGSAHIQISNNTVHNSGVSGISTTRADYVSIILNTVYANSTYTSSGMFGSGISTYENLDTDHNTGVKMIIARNFVYKNTNTPGSKGGTDPDGNGIILDDLRHTQSDKNAYRGQTLIDDNVVYSNGGAGIYVYSSDHAIVDNNTAYRNNQDPFEASWRPGEIVADSSGDVQMYNNIAFSDGANCDRQTTGCDVSITVDFGSWLPINIDYDMFYNSQNDTKLEYYLGTDKGHGNSNTVTVGSNNFWDDPLFVNPNLSEFMLQPGSPGWSAANPTVAPKNDIRGRPRPLYGPTEMGAYQQSR